LSCNSFNVFCCIVKKEHLFTSSLNYEWRWDNSTMLWFESAAHIHRCRCIDNMHIAQYTCSSFQDRILGKEDRDYTLLGRITNPKERRMSSCPLPNVITLLLIMIITIHSKCTPLFSTNLSAMYSLRALHFHLPSSLTLLLLQLVTITTPLIQSILPKRVGNARKRSSTKKTQCLIIR